MYSLGNDFIRFYWNHVVLSAQETKNLREKYQININRVKNGLSEYNEENKTSYELLEHVVQGSVSMATITQNDDQNYDIDVAVVFDTDELPEGTTATKNIIVDSLKRKCKSFNTEPEFKTNCIRIQYEDGYHIDFAVYRRSEKNFFGRYEYEHCGSQFRRRDPRAINRWYLGADAEKGGYLNPIVRLLKMFTKSRSSWNMPGGLILSVLAYECFGNGETIEEVYVETLKNIYNRLFWNTEVLNPVDTSTSLLLTEADNIRIDNLKKRLETYLEKLEVLENWGCSRKEAIDAWEVFFNHSYFIDLKNDEVNHEIILHDEEKYINELFYISNEKSLELDCYVINNDSGTVERLSNILSKGKKIPLKRELEFFINETNVSYPYKVYWKVRNSGDVALSKNMLRGDISTTGNDTRSKEESSFAGNHYVECYLIKNDVCVATDIISVPIG